MRPGIMFIRKLREEIFNREHDGGIGLHVQAGEYPSDHLSFSPRLR